MVEIVLFVLAVGLFLYTILGGADFGAGVLEIFMGRRSMKTINKALAPVWEANHMWLILVVVVVMNGFPKVYATLSHVLHIPLLIILIGIIFRGTAFTFRHYDVEEDNTHRYYNFFFRSSSIITPLFLGITLGAMILGRVTLDMNLGFYEVFIAPWLNIFCFSMGLFTTCLFTYLSAVFLVNEVKDVELQELYVKAAKRSLWICFIAGGFVFLSASLSDLDLFSKFIQSPFSMVAMLIATILIPFIYRLLNDKKKVLLRVVVGAQTMFILIGWAVVQNPVFIYMRNGEHLTITNSQSPESTFVQLVIALVVGSCLIFPGVFYLFKVFKSD